jgi:hypothetical protein
LKNDASLAIMKVYFRIKLVSCGNCSHRTAVRVKTNKVEM